jgi:NADPH:quinone reductase-like Zn-dependent oxidoreductase
MRAVMYDRYGSADELRLGRTAVPTIGENEVLLRVRAAGLDRGAWHLMAGTPYAVRLAIGLRRPRNPVLGREVAGDVVAVGARVTRFTVGDEVFGMGNGTFAEFAAAKEDKLAAKPAGLSYAEAATLTISALTALQAVTDVAKVQPGQHVLITGASGGVGSYAVQLAKAVGARVTGVAGPTKLDLVRSLGADQVIDYTQADFADGSHRYDVILDIAGNPSVAKLRRALTPTGTAVIIGGEEGGPLTGGLDRQLRAALVSKFTGQRMTGMLCKERAVDLDRLAGYVADGKLTASVDRTYPLDRAPEAMRRLADGTARGKIAITLEAAA